VSAQSKPREGYQRFGQLIREEFDENVWVKHLASTVEFLEDSRKTRGIVITDLRQPNEYEWCRANGFIIVRVTAPDELRIARAKAAGDDFSAEDLSHETESHVDSFVVDYEIHNDGTIADLDTKVDEMMAEIGG
jgi:dephospho-CoA kinase